MIGRGKEHRKIAGRVKPSACLVEHLGHGAAGVGRRREGCGERSAVVEVLMSFDLENRLDLDRHIVGQRRRADGASERRFRSPVRRPRPSTR